MTPDGMTPEHARLDWAQAAGRTRQRRLRSRTTSVG
jgi:hypothetical protein